MVRPGTAAGDVLGGGSGSAGLEELLVPTRGTNGAVLNISNQARVLISGTDANTACVCKMIFSYSTTKSNDCLNRVRGIGRDNSRCGDIPAG